MKVFLDLDGVLVNFLGGLHKSLMVPHSYEDYPYEKGKWNMLTDIKGFDGIPATFEQCNDCCSSVFWANLDWMHDGRLILNEVQRKFGEIYLLTTPMPNPGSGTGKLWWIKKHIPNLYKKTILSYAPKSLLAGPNTLLIDDKDENIEGFEAAGGRGILVPRPWNKLHGWAGETLQVVKNKLEEF